MTYIEPGDYGGSQVLARAKLNARTGSAARELQVMWRQMPRGKGGQASGQIAFLPDGSICICPWATGSG
jgi:aldose sugar dehydrogenase